MKRPAGVGNTGRASEVVHGNKNEKTRTASILAYCTQKGKAYMKFTCKKPEFVGKLDQFAARDVSAREVGRLFNADCRLEVWIPEKKTGREAVDKKEVPA